MAFKFSTEVLVIDVESTCWDQPRPPKGMTSEIIEIGIAGVDIVTPTITFSDSIMVKPVRSKVSNFCTHLTTLTQEDVDEGILHHEACQQLKNKYSSHKKTMVSWGDYDRNMFNRMATYNDSRGRYPFGRSHLNLKNMFSIVHGLNKEIGMEQALAHIGEPLQGIHHRGVDDAKNIAVILVHTLMKFRGL